MKFQKALPEKSQVLVVSNMCGVGGETRPVQLYSRLVCLQKIQKCKLILRLLSILSSLKKVDVHFIA